MKAIVLKDFGSIENLIMEEVPMPDVRTDEVLVKVKAIGIDQIDLKTRQGGGMANYLREESPMILGWDIAGEVVTIGDEVKELKVNDAVFGTVRFPGHGNAYAEYVAAPASQLALKPANITFEEAAGATQSPLTAWQALVDAGHIKKGDRVLIHGASGGVGSFAVQIAKQFGSYVIGTASGANKKFVTSLGVDEFIDYKIQKFEDIVKEADLILDPIGGDNFVRSLAILKPEGIIILLPSDKKAAADKIAEEKKIKNYRHILMHSSGKDMKMIAAMLAEGRLHSFVSKIFTFNQIPQAHQEMVAGNHTGKIVVVI